MVTLHFTLFGKENIVDIDVIEILRQLPRQIDSIIVFGGYQSIYWLWLEKTSKHKVENLLILWFHAQRKTGHRNEIQSFDFKVGYFNNTADPETQAKEEKQDCRISEVCLKLGLPLKVH